MDSTVGNDTTDVPHRYNMHCLTIDIANYSGSMTGKNATIAVTHEAASFGVTIYF